jgi:hypothetical protein
MLARVCAAQMARTIVRALHVTPPGITQVEVKEKTKRKPAKGRKKKSPAGGC